MSAKFDRVLLFQFVTGLETFVYPQPIRHGYLITSPTELVHKTRNRATSTTLTKNLAGIPEGYRSYFMSSAATRGRSSSYSCCVLNYADDFVLHRLEFGTKFPYFFREPFTNIRVFNSSSVNSQLL